MINWALYRKELRANWVPLAIFAAVLAMYVSIIMSMYDPEKMSLLEEYAKAMPELMAAMGMTPGATTMIGFMISYLYGFIVVLFPMIFSVIAAHRLIARYVDKGSMAALLAAPIKRRTIAFTQMKVLGTGIVALVVFTTVLQVAWAEFSDPDGFDLGQLLGLNVGLLGLQLLIGAICFLASCAFSDAKYAIAVGAGVPLLGFIIQMLSQAGSAAANLKYATFFTLFDPTGLIEGGGTAIAGAVVMYVLAAALAAAAIAVFSRKDLHI